MNTLVICPSCERANRVALDGAWGRQPICGSCKKELPLHGGVSEVNGSTLAKLLQVADRPVVVDFWAPWCGPCKVFAPVYEEAASRLGGQVILTKLNTQDSPMAGQAYQVRSIPTLIVFRGATEVARQSGAMQLPAFLELVKPWLQGEARSA